ncbi:MAG: acyl-CoA thioesterase [Bifidobacteriaceae bacterium]|jgi:acyl-CoA thioester hydrolase|nr:acyl-CoA thioesterase [Bifidobacteriaceae bacterium]
MPRLEIPVQLRWGDLDAYQHVNNAAMLHILEEARIEGFWKQPEESEPRYPTAVLDSGLESGSPSFVARQEIEYLAPLDYRRQPVIVEMWIGKLGGSSADVCCLVKDPGPEGTVFARATTTVVFIDMATGRSQRIDDETRAAWEPYVDEPIKFRHRV